jgi:hypothetical protein
MCDADRANAWFAPVDRARHAAAMKDYCQLRSAFKGLTGSPGGGEGDLGFRVYAKKVR